MDQLQEHYRRVVKELCNAVGFSDVERAYSGHSVTIEKLPVWFTYSDMFDAGHILVHVDIGVPKVDNAETYKSLLRTNFEMGTGTRGVMSLHPANDHVLYTFRYRLTAESSGKELLEWVSDFVKGI